MVDAPSVSFKLPGSSARFGIVIVAVPQIPALSDCVGMSSAIVASTWRLFRSAGDAVNVPRLFVTAKAQLSGSTLCCTR